MKKKELKRQLKAERRNKRTSNIIHNPSIEMINTQSIWHDAILDIDKIIRNDIANLTWKKREPKVGDWVHYLNAAGNHLPAVVTDPQWVQHEDGTYSQALTVFLVMNPPRGVAAAEGNDEGTWHWPEE